ncbi:hypothetical protein [Anianabacter salinae]|uniref:hypothetical protein n=1 Tax=Anianabacter salinae TaxID=2851023 RepID=UPI00225DD8B8|nr:hypothetical protein [Anianabacter salinae]MBV0913318.1 hypothetical protein [Anianabacter salinae]
MSTWICNPFGAACLAALILSGCTGGTGARPEMVTRFAVSGGDVVIAGPRGFCVDPGASSATGTPAFVLLSSCVSVTGSARAARPAQNALLTASVATAPPRGPDGPDLAEALRQFFATEAGRAAIARSGDPADVTLADASVDGDGVVLWVEDRGPGRPELASGYWRGVFALNGRLVTVSAIGYADRPLSRDDGLRLVRQFRTATEAASPRAASGNDATAGEENAPIRALLSFARLRR